MVVVRDIMQTDVVTIRADDSARTLARVLADSEISGVPVLDGKGQVVGVASSTDLVRLAAEDSDVNLTEVMIRPDTERVKGLEVDETEELGEEADPFGFFLPEDSPFSASDLLENVPESTFDAVSVSDLMTPVSFAVQPDLPVPELCEYLVRGRIHRALVVEDGELIGIVTSQDVLRSVAESRVTV